VGIGSLVRQTVDGEGDVKLRGTNSCNDFNHVCGQPELMATRLRAVAQIASRIERDYESANRSCRESNHLASILRSFTGCR